MRRALKPCTEPGCPNLVQRGRCADHRKDRHRRFDRTRGTAAQRGYDARWRRIRAQVLAEEPLCRFCTEQGRTTAAEEVDHIDGDSRNNARTNLRALCKSCHSSRTATDQSGWGSGDASH